ncbi:MAG: hypothetical protein H6719_33475 [Sandaracinaceae bacterium]|nr:hypothetical protein [Sandaracinaceae bacterium]
MSATADGSGEAVWRRRAWGAALGCVALLTLLGNPAHRGGNTASRLATVESLVHRGTFDISESPFLDETVDYVRLDGRALSSKPPLLPVVAAGVYAALHALGLDIVEDLGVVHRAIVLVVETVPQALLLLAGFLWLELVSRDPRARGWTFVLLCFGFLGAGYATTLNNHSPAAAAVVGCLYFTTKLARAERPAPRDLIAAGLCLGVAPTLDFLTAPAVAGFGAILLWRWPKATLTWVLAAAALPIAAHVGLTYLATGSVLPIYARGDLYQFEGGYWTSPRGLDALDEPKWLYAFHLLFGHHGLFLLTPILGFGLWQAVLQVRDRRPLWREALVALVALVVVGVAMILRTHNYGGACVGFRWLIPVMPLLILLCLPFLESAGSRGRIAIAVAGFVSFTTFVNAAVHPWSHSGVHWLFHQVVDTGALL